ncbi:hypothetical protein JCM3775_005219 [Rhodotorula graminis]
MASSQYSASPVPPARIRVVAHPPLAPLRAWLPLPLPTSLHRAPVVADVLAAVSRLLQGRTDIACEIQGFTVLTDSPLSVLDPVNDILDIKVATAPLPPFPDTLAPPVIPPYVAPAAQAAAVPLPPSSSSGIDTDTSSDADSCSDMDESSDDEAAPEVLPSKRPLALANGHGPAPPPALDGDERPAKRQRTVTRSPAPASSSSSSSSSSSTSSSSSDSSSSSSDSDTDSDSATSHVDTPVSPRRVLAALVPPGEGKRRTRKRNQRKRMLKAARKRERALDAAPVDPPATTEKETAAEELGDVGEPICAPLAPPKPASPIKPVPPHKAPAVAPRPPATPTRLALSTPELALPATAPSRKYSTGGEPGISLVSAGTRNTPSSERGAGGTRAGVSKAQKRGFFREPQPAVGGVAAPLPDRSTAAQEEQALAAQGSPVYTPTSPAFSPSTALDDVEPATVPAPVSASATRPGRADEHSQPRAPRFVSPSKRTDLPPNLVITSVDVEAAGWEPGVGRVVKGTSREWVAPARPVRSVDEFVRDVPAVAEEPQQEQGAGWEGWRRADEVAQGWDKLRPLKKGDSAARSGARVAVKVLELDPSTFAPTLALKYGRLLDPSPSSSSLRIELHPDCLAPALDPADDEWYGDDDEAQGDETAYHAKPRIRFGEDLFMAEQDEGEERGYGDEGVWEGEWEGADVRLVVGL